MKRAAVALGWAGALAACGARTSLESPLPIDGGASLDAATSTDADSSSAVGPDTGHPPPPPDAAAIDAAPPQLVAYAESASVLYQVELPSGALATSGATGDSLYDIAFLPAGSLYGSGAADLDLVDPASGATTPVGPLDTLYNGLGAGPDGLLYGAGAGEIARIDPATGAATPVASFPPGFSSSGDLAALGGILYASATNGGASDFLLTVDPAAGTSAIVGPIGYACVYGLAAVGSALYGFTCAGQVVGIEPSSGAGTLVATPGVTFFGASAR